MAEELKTFADEITSAIRDGTKRINFRITRELDRAVNVAGRLARWSDSYGREVKKTYKLVEPRDDEYCMAEVATGGGALDGDYDRAPCGDFPDIAIEITSISHTGRKVVSRVSFCHRETVSHLPRRYRNWFGLDVFR